MKTKTLKKNKVNVITLGCSKNTFDSEVLMALEQDSTIVHEVEIGQASLINTGPLHSSHNPTNESRFVVTIGLFDKLTETPLQYINDNRMVWDDVVIRMENYISGTN